MTQADWIQNAVLLTLVLLVYLGRDWAKQLIRSGVQHDFDRELEVLRSQLRAAEQRFNEEFARKEAQLEVLRNNALGLRAHREAILETRRLQAVDRVWSEVVDLAPYKSVVLMMATMNLEAIAKRVPHDDKLRRVMGMIGNLPKGEPPKAAVRERPHLSPLAWSLFSAYQAILLIAWSTAKALELGLSDVEHMLNHDSIKGLLKSALSDQSAKIGASTSREYFLHVEELEKRLLDELKRMMVGEEYDSANVAKAVEILHAVENATEANNQVVVAASGLGR